MRIILLSDLHIADSGMPIWDTDTTLHFEKAIQLIGNIPSVDAIIVLGDVADKGSQWAYDFVKHKFDNLCVPTYLIPGNHDDIKRLMAVMNSQWCHTCKSVDIQNWKFIFLSSVMPDPNDTSTNMSRGYLSDDEIALLNKELNTKSKTCILLHHPPIEQEGWLNRKLLENRTDFNEIIRTYENVSLVIYGHTHYHSIKHIDGVTYIGSPAVGFAFNKDLPKFQIDKGAEGFLILDINNQTIQSKRVLLYE